MLRPMISAMTGLIRVTMTIRRATANPESFLFILDSGCGSFESALYISREKATMQGKVWAKKMNMQIVKIKQI